MALLSLLSFALFFLLRGVFPPPLDLIPWLFVLSGTWSFALAVWPSPKANDTVLNLLGKTWTLNDLCRGWLVTGRTGSGKTFFANRFNREVLKNIPDMGLLCLDFKGIYWDTLKDIASAVGRHKDLRLIQVRRPDSPPEWTPPYTLNITGNRTLPAATLAKVIAETFHSLKKKEADAFFAPTAQRAIELGIDILRKLNLPVTIPNIYAFLRDPETRDIILHGLTEKADSGDAHAAKLKQFIHAEIFDLPPETLGGVTGNITLYLAPFLLPPIAETFCAEHPTFDLAALDSGAIISLSIPQIYQEERLFINSIVKLLGMFHILSRFDLTKEELKKKNFILVQADEGQELITAAESALADHRIAGTMREARATIMVLTQAYTSLFSSLDKKFANTLMVNLANQIIYQAADEESAKIASKAIGEKYVVEKTWGLQGGRRSYNFARRLKPHLEPHELRDFKKFQCVVVHCEKGWKKGFLPPLEPNGTICSWYKGPKQ